MLVYICVSVVLTWQCCRKESQKLDINLDRHSVWGVSLRESVTMYFFKVFEYQVGMSARFDPRTLGLGGGVCGCRAARIFPRWLFKGESTVGPTAQGILGLCAKKVYCNVLI